MITANSDGPSPDAHGDTEPADAARLEVWATVHGSLEKLPAHVREALAVLDAEIRKATPDGVGTEGQPVTLVQPMVLTGPEPRAADQPEADAGGASPAAPAARAVPPPLAVYLPVAPDPAVDPAEVRARLMRRARRLGDDPGHEIPVRTCIPMVPYRWNLTAAGNRAVLTGGILHVPAPGAGDQDVAGPTAPGTTPA